MKSSTSTKLMVVCMVVSKAVLPALQIPIGFWADLAGWLLPGLLFLGVQILWKFMLVLHLDQYFRELREKLHQFWVGRNLLSLGKSLLSDISKFISDSFPTTTSSSSLTEGASAEGSSLDTESLVTGLRAKFKWLLEKLQLWITPSLPGSRDLLELLSELKGGIDHEIQQDLSRDG